MIHHGDALAWLATIEPESVDAVVCDPPYSSGGAFRSDRATKTGTKYSSRSTLPDFHGDSRTERGLLLWTSLWLGECWRVTHTGGAIAVFTDWRSLPTITDALQAGGWSWRGIGVWTKPQHRSRPTTGGLWNDSEFVVWGSRGPRTTGDCLPGTWFCEAPRPTARQHQTEKPQEVLRDLVRLAPPGGLVIDPFAGSGSTGVAALAMGRRFAGCELSADYAARATARLAAPHAIASAWRHDADALPF